MSYYTNQVPLVPIHPFGEDAFGEDAHSRYQNLNASTISKPILEGKLNTLTIGPLIAAVSGGIFLLHLLGVWKRIGALFRKSNQDEASKPIPVDFEMPYKYLILAFNILRFLGCVTLFALSVVLCFRDSTNEDSFLESVTRGLKFTPRSWLDLAQCAVFLYTCLLSFLILTSTWIQSSTYHLNTILFAEFAIYFYRDVVPLGTFTLAPLDGNEGNIIWAFIAVLGFTSIIIPLGIPSRYLPYDPSKPMSVMNPEQTASIFSLLTFYFAERLIFKAFRTPHLPYEELPVLADYDQTVSLKKKTFSHLDRFSGAPKRHLFFGLLAAFARQWTFLSWMAIIMVVGELAAPVGVNRLLYYIETGGKDAIVRPWVWIILLFVGPMSVSLSQEWYLYHTNWILVKLEAIMTQLLFEHSLKIRLKAETGEEEKIVTVPSTPVTAEPSTSDEEDDSSTAGGSTIRAEPSEATTETLHSSSSSIKSSMSGKDSKKKAEEPKKADMKNLAGKINNLVTTDLANVGQARDILRVVLMCPFQMALSIWFLYVVLGWSAFVGLGTMIVLLPLPGWVTKLVGTAAKEVMKKKDARVEQVTEVMNVIRMIKQFGWEKRMFDKIGAKRGEELVWIRWRRIINVLSFTVNYTVPAVTMLTTYATYTLIMKKQLTSSVVFSSMTVFGLIRWRLGTIMFSANMIMTAKVSLDRLNDYFQDTELLDNFADKEAVILAQPPTAEANTIGFCRATFSWAVEDVDGSVTPSKRAFRLHIDNELTFQRGAINLIVGPTGSGKTCMLLALLGEMHFIPQRPDSWYNLPRQHGVSYAPQESWVLNDTIRNNIIFHSEYDEARYKKVLYQCALEPDLKLFDAGDQTEVGEKGLTLSGGQKARVTLARAIYSRAEIILLDDVLAALDVHTSSWIVKHCFGGDLVKDRTVILVTHNIALTAPLADYVVSIHDGRVFAEGSAKEVLKHDKTIAAEAKEDKEALKKLSEEVDAPPADGEAAPKTDGKLIVAEEIAIGAVGWAPIWRYLKAMGGDHLVLFCLGYLSFDFMHEIFWSAQPWYLGYWANQYNDPTIHEVPVLQHLLVYFLLTIGCMVGIAICVTIFSFGAVRASRVIHNELMAAILGTTMRWLDVTPVSRVLARCTNDIGEIDSTLAMYMDFTTQLAVAMTVEFSAIFVVTPVFIPMGLLVFVIGYTSGRIYMKAQIAVKREMSNAKAPILAHFGASMAGLASIRAYGMQETFILEQMERTNKYTRIARSFHNLNRWISVRLQFISEVFAVGLASYLFYSGTYSPGNIGFILEMAVLISQQLLHFVTMMNQLEVTGNCLERVEQYIKIEQEPKPTQQGTPPAYWPASGNLSVQNLKARYSDTGPNVLHDISFEIKSGERIGVVGRTGSGKSSLTLSLLRLIVTEGKMIYDGLNTTELNLDALRSSITIIPQVPELLSGTLRENLDPFDQHDDATLNDALRSAGLFALQNNTEEGRLTLDSPVASSGNNLSVGQRQILALARALVRKSKLLILDEATSAIDYKTDSIIQSSLRHELKDVTLLTIAHRLQTIMDADKILVLDAGKVVEFDSPKNLLHIKGGKLKALVDESNDRDALYKMAGTEHHHFFS